MSNQDIIDICRTRENYSYPDVHIWVTMLFDAIARRYGGGIHRLHFTEQLCVLADVIRELSDAQIAPSNKQVKPTRQRATKSPVALFEYHTLYTLAQIETIAGQFATRSPGITHLPNQASVLGREGEQYDFCGDDDDHLILLWIDDQRNL